MELQRYLRAGDLRELVNGEYMRVTVAYRSEFGVEHLPPAVAAGVAMDEFDRQHLVIYAVEPERDEEGTEE